MLRHFACALYELRPGLAGVSILEGVQVTPEARESLCFVGGFVAPFFARQEKGVV